MQDQLFVIDDSMEVVSEDRWVQYRKVACVYAIRHVSSGKVYIGSAIDLYGRWGKHVSELRLNRHHNQKLQNAWNKYGQSEFQFILIARCDKENAVALEQEWMDKVQAVRNGYNLCPVAGSILGTKLTEENKGKIAASKRGKARPRHVIEKMSEGRRAAGPRAVSDETKERLRVSSTGKKHTDETKAKLSALRAGKKGPSMPAHLKVLLLGVHLGRKHTDEAKAKMSEFRSASTGLTDEDRDRIKRKFVQGCRVNGRNALALEYNVSQTTIWRIVTGKR